MDGVADNATFSASARGASFVRGVWMCNVRCGGRFKVNFLLGMGVVGRSVVVVVAVVAVVVVVFGVAIAVSELALRLLSLMTSPVTVGETEVAKLQLDIFQ